MRRILNFVLPCIVLATGVSCSVTNSNKIVNPPASDALSGSLMSIYLKGDSTMLLGAFDMEEALAFFWSNPGDTMNQLVDSVFVNGNNLEVNEDGDLYSEFDSLGNELNMVSTCNWQVFGNGNIPSFSYNYAVGYPTFTGNLPDTVTKGAGLTMNLNFSGSDSVTITIAPDTLGNVIQKSFSPNNTAFTFSASELGSLLTTDSIGAKSIITVIAHNSTVQTFSSKKFLFSKTLQYSHAVRIE